MMIYRAYRFATEAAAMSALAGLDPVALDVIGIAYAASDDAEALPEALPGWHVNAAWNSAPACLADAEIDAAEAPRWWAGVPRAAPAALPAVPLVVSARQARLALLQAGLLDAVEAAISEMSAAARLTWEYAVEIRRDDPLLTGMAAALGLTDAQTDALFITAATL